MIAADSRYAMSECERILALLARHQTHPDARAVLRDAHDVRRLLSLYSFRSPQRAERLCAELSSRYRADLLVLYGHSALARRQSSSAYLQLEQLLSLLVRVAALRLTRAGVLNLSLTQLTASDGMLLALIEAQI